MVNGHGDDVAAEVARIAEATDAAHHRLTKAGERIHALEGWREHTAKHLDALWADHVPALHNRCESIEHRVEQSFNRLALLIVVAFAAVRFL